MTRAPIVIAVGPPATGKSLVARAISNFASAVLFEDEGTLTDPIVEHIRGGTPRTDSHIAVICTYSETLVAEIICACKAYGRECLVLRCSRPA
jgi:hypothetical protein